MFLVNAPGMTFHNKIVDLIYKLIFRGLKTLDFRHMSYFALVFAAQMLVLEYYSEHAMLQQMLDFFLHRFLVLYAIESLGARFESLFVSREAPDENFFQGNSPDASQSRSGRIFFSLNPKVDIERVLWKLNASVIDLINQVIFCRTKIVEELIKVKVADRVQEPKPPSKEELKKRFFRIEDLKERKLMDLLLMVRKKTAAGDDLVLYNSLSQLRNFLVGGDSN